MVQKGQLWKENDNRIKREVTVLAVDGKYATIKTVSCSEGAVGKITKARLDRFNGKHGGYSLVEKAKVAQKTQKPKSRKK